MNKAELIKDLKESFNKGDMLSVDLVIELIEGLDDNDYNRGKLDGIKTANRMAENHSLGIKCPKCDSLDYLKSDNGDYCLSCGVGSGKKSEGEEV